MIAEVTDEDLPFVCRLLAKSGVMFWGRRRKIYKLTTVIFVCLVCGVGPWVEMDNVWYRFRVPEIGYLVFEKSTVRP